MSIDITYLRDLKLTLALQDTRSVVAYCQHNNIQIFGQKKRRYVLSVQFKRALLHEKINALKEKYGDSWTEVLKSEINLCTQLQSALDEIEKGRSNSHAKSKVHLKGESDQQFIIDCLKILS